LFCGVQTNTFICVAKIPVSDFAHVDHFFLYHRLMPTVQDLSGIIEDGVLGNLLQYLASAQLSGTMLIQNDQDAGQVYFRRGRVAHAVTNRYQAVNAIAEMLTWTSGKFHFRSGDYHGETTINSSVEHLLLRASQEVDEAQRQTPRATQPALNADMVLVHRNATSPNDQIQIPGRAIVLLTAADGRRTLGTIAQQLKMPLETVFEMTQQLLAVGLVSVHHNPSVNNPPKNLVPGFAEEFSTLMVRIVGPVGEIIVDDAMDELDLRTETLSSDLVPALLQKVFSQLKAEPQRQQFNTTIRALRSKYGC
jgi:hypothetical protein